MKVGQFAVYRGVTYRARLTPRREGLTAGLFAPGSAPRPDGFEWDDRGMWFARVVGADLDEAYEIEVWARAPGGWVVQVDDWDEKTGRAAVVHMTYVQEQSPFGRYEEPAGEPPYLNHRRYDLLSEGAIPGDQLTDVRSVRRDVALPGRRVS